MNRPVHAQLAVRALSLAALLCLFVACKSGKSTIAEPVDGFNRSALIAQLVDETITPLYQRISDQADSFQTHCSAYADAVDGGEPADALKHAAQSAWVKLMDAWQQAEMIQIGPAGPPDARQGGQGLRDEIYSWPSTNPCRIDQEIVSQAYMEDSFFEQQLVNVYGLDAIEYLLYVDSDTNACAPQATINQGSWSQLGPTELRKRRARYAARAASHVVQNIVKLGENWGGENGFAPLLRQAGEGDSPFRSAQAAIDEIFAAMYYIELKVKDAKLATVAGLRPECETTACPERVESRWARRSKEHIIANLRMFRTIFVGGDGTGFDDFLATINAADLATKIISNTDAALGSMEVISGTLYDTVTTNRQRVIDGYDAVKTVTDLLKSQFVTLLNLKIPDEGAADND